MRPAALVTGGARRIGSVLSRRLAAAGYAVAIHYHRSADEAEALASSLITAGGEAMAIGADLTDARAVRRLLPDCAARLGPIGVLINNAAGFRNDSAAQFSDAQFTSHLETNLHAPLILAQALAAQAMDSPRCAINLLDSKVAALNPDFFTYTLAKVALAGATRMMAMEFAGIVHVNGIAPGITLLSGKQSQAGFERAWSAPPLGRSSTPEEIAEAMMFILETPSLNGQILVLDGGEGLVQRGRDLAFAG